MGNAGRFGSRLCKNAGARFFCRSIVPVATSTGPFRLAEKYETREMVVWRAGLSVLAQPRKQSFAIECYRSGAVDSWHENLFCTDIS